MKGGDWGVGVGLDYRETNAFSHGGFRGGGDPFPLLMFQSSGGSRRGPPPPPLPLFWVKKEEITEGRIWSAGH